MDDVAFVELWASIAKQDGTLEDFNVAYRKATGSEAKESSLKSSNSNRVNTLRKGLSGKGISEEKVMEVLPRLRRATRKGKKKTRDWAGIIKVLQLEGQMEASE